MKKGSFRKALRSSRKLLIMWAILALLALVSTSDVSLNDPNAVDGVEDTALVVLVYVVRGLILLLLASVGYFVYKLISRARSRFS